MRTGYGIGFYEGAVDLVTDRIKPYLRHITQQFIERSVNRYAQGNPQFAQLIEFEIRRRGDGAGLTQDVAEPLIWIGVKTFTAVTVALASQSITGQWIGTVAALCLISNQVVELLRVIPRYTAGLQGSLEMARYRWHSIEQTGKDPFNLRAD